MCNNRQASDASDSCRYNSRAKVAGRILKLFIMTLFLLSLPFGKAADLDGQSTGLSGFKYFKNYSPQDYNGHNQNWAVLQDKRGIIFVANQGGIKEFDGAFWRQINIRNLIVRSMAGAENGTLYVGGKDEFGYLAPDSQGSLQYKSLIEHVETKNRNFGDVWRTHAIKEKIYFRTANFLFCWHSTSRQIKTWKTDYRFYGSFTYGGKFFIRQQNTGLMQMDTASDSLQLVPGGEIFSKMGYFAILPCKNQKLLIGTRAKGFYLYDGIHAVPFPTEADNYLQENQLSHGIRLYSGDFALATLRGGLIIMDAAGKLKEIFNKAYGLQDDNVKYVFQDSPGNLWLALSKGISKIEYISPLSTYDERSNLPGNVLAVVKHQRRLYVGTDRGLFLLDPPQGFRLAAGISSNCWALLSTGDSLLAAATDGVFQVENHMKQLIIKDPSYALLPSQQEAGRIWIGTQEGLRSIKKGNNQWKEERKFENITQEIETIVEDKNGNLWLGTKTNGVINVEFPAKGTIINPVCTRYYTSHGLPGGWIRVYQAAGHVMFATEKGIFRFDKNNKTFTPDSTFGKEFAGGPKGKNVFIIATRQDDARTFTQERKKANSNEIAPHPGALPPENKNKDTWLHSDFRNIQAIPQPGGTFVLNKKPFLRIPNAQVNTIYPDPSGNITWFAGNNGLIRYDIKVKKNYRFVFSALVRKVRVKRTLVFDGYKSRALFTVIPYKDRNLRFEFAAPFFEDETGTQYQCFLEGYETDWSDWTSETRKDYTNLDAGRYTFRVRAQNVYGNLSREAVFQFKVLPPWYKTWWAFIIYVIAALLTMFLVVKWRSGKLGREKQKLEQIVQQRTGEIETKNRQLADQAEKLAELDRVKSRFFANISHEFRTPLTLIMGPLDRIHSECKEQVLKKEIGLVYRNARLLLRLINQLLELARFESGKMKLQAKQGELLGFMRSILEPFQSAAARQRLSLTFHSAAALIPLFFDPEKLERVFVNLLANAFQFTPPGGRVRVSVTVTTAAGEIVESPPAPGGHVNVSVKDSGTGIPADQLTHVFDRFYQAGTTAEHHRKGSGIGLALVKELVTLHHGEILVRSQVGENSGTEFIVRLPTGSKHLAAAELATNNGETPGQDAALPLLAPEAIETLESGDSPATETAIPPHQLAGSESMGKNMILVVEDNADLRSYIRTTLEPGYTVVEAKNGREGIEKARTLVPDLIISDIMMPEADGYELCRMVKSDISTSHIPVVLLTAKASEESIIRGLETRADDYITKPFSTRIMNARIRNLIELRRQLQLKLNREMLLKPFRVEVSELDREFLKDLQAVIEKNLSEPDFNVEDLSKRLYMSRTTVYRKILALSGETPTDFIRSYRLMRAAQLLKTKFGSVTEVAFEVGFSSRTYFTRCFKEKFHQLPSEYNSS